MSLLRDLPPDLLSEVCIYADRASLLSLTRTNRNLAAEMSSKQDFTWRSLVARDWGDWGAFESAEQEQPQSSPQPSASPQPAGSEDGPAESHESGGVHRLPSESWRDAYRRHAVHFGPAARCYGRVAPVWRRLLAWIDAHQTDLPRIKETIAPTFASSSSSPASAAFAAASAAASGASPPPSPSPSYAELTALLAQKQVEWRMFQLVMRRQLKRELEDEARHAVDKRGSKRDRSAAASAAAAAAAAGSSGGSSGASSASPSPSHDSSAHPQSDASDSAAPMDFETAIGLPRVEAAPSPAEQKQLEESDGALPLTEFCIDQELMCTLLLHNGQTEVTRRDQVSTGLFGGFSFYSFTCQNRLLDMSSMLDMAMEEAQHRAQQEARLAAKTRAQNKRRKSETDAGRGAATAAGAAAAAGAGAGAGAGSSSQVTVTAADQPKSVELMLPFTFSPIGSSADFFVRCSSGAVVRRYYDGSLHVVAPSFLSFFTRYVSDLESGCFGFDRTDGINRFPLLSDTGSDTVTRGIRVQVSVLFVPEQSDPHGAASGGRQFFFAYSIRISHDLSTAVRARLVSRHWIIEDANGHVDDVQGPGVVGLTPDIYPGCPLFTYQSCSPIPTRTGKMRGSFRFKCDNTDEEFDAIVNTFHFDADRNYC